MSDGPAGEVGGARAAGRLRHYRAGGGSVGGPGSYSDFVGLMRYLLPTLAAALLGLVVAWPLISGGEEGFHVPLGEDAGIDGRLTMVNASYQGTDPKNRPFTIRGDEAFQTDSKSPIVYITGIGADLFVGGGKNRQLAMTAREGVYDRDSEFLDLSGDVTVRSDEGHEFHTASAHIDLPAGVARGDEPVSGTGPHGLLDAGNFALIERGKIMTFGGRVRMTVYPDAVGGADGDEERRGAGRRS